MNSDLTYKIAAIYCATFAFCISGCNLQRAAAQSVDPSITPTQFLGKSFEECEKILGKPSVIQTPTGSRRMYARYYKTRHPKLKRIVLKRIPQGSAGMASPIPATVNAVAYDVPRKSVPTWQDAVALIGFDPSKTNTESGLFLLLSKELMADWRDDDPNNGQGSINQQREQAARPDEFQLTVMKNTISEKQLEFMRKMKQRAQARGRGN